MALAPRLRAALAGLGLALAPGPALAETADVTDGADDVLVTVDGDDYSHATQPTVDITGAHFVHGSRRVVAAVHFTDLSDGRQDTTLLVKTAKKESFTIVGAVHADGAKVITVLGPDGHVACAGARLRVGYDADLMRLAIPRTCLGRPAWVKLAAEAAKRITDKYYLDYGGLAFFPSVASERTYTKRLAKG